MVNQVQSDKIRNQTIKPKKEALDNGRCDGPQTAAMLSGDP